MDYSVIQEFGLSTVATGIGLYLFKNIIESIIKQNDDNNKRLSETLDRVTKTNSELVEGYKQISVDNKKAIEELTKEIRKLTEKRG